MGSPANKEAPKPHPEKDRLTTSRVCCRTTGRREKTPGSQGVMSPGSALNTGEGIAIIATWRCRDHVQSSNKQYHPTWEFMRHGAWL